MKKHYVYEKHAPVEAEPVSQPANRNVTLASQSVALPIPAVKTAEDLVVTEMKNHDLDPAFGFVYAAIRDSVRHQFPKMSDDTYYKQIGAEIATYLKDKDTTTYLLQYADADLKNEYLGFISVMRGYDKPIRVLYIYVKAAYRGLGLSRYMLDKIPEGNRFDLVYGPNDEWYLESLRRKGVIVTERKFIE